METFQKKITLRSVNKEYLSNQALVKSKKVTMLPGREIYTAPNDNYRKIEYLLKYIFTLTKSNIDFVCARHVLKTVMESTYAYGDEEHRNQWKIIAMKRKETIYLAMLHRDDEQSLEKLYPNGLEFEEFLLSNGVSNPNKNRYKKSLKRKENVFKVYEGQLGAFKVLYSAEIDGTNGDALVEIKLWNGREDPKRYFKWWL